MEHKKFIQASEELLFSSDFQELRDVLEFRAPNIWHILGISRREIRVNRFLAWLINPKANHSLDEQFLKDLAIEALKTEIGREREITPLDLLVMDLSDVRVRREYPLRNRRCDILTHSKQSGFLCIIENKVEAQEGDEQTQDYYDASLDEFSTEQYPHRVYIYLSPDGEPPACEHFIPLSYQTVLQVIEKLDEPMSDTERFLLQQFQENIRRDIAMDKSTLDLAQAIYDQYPEVFEFIFQSVDRYAEDAPVEKEWDGKSRFFNIGEKADSGYRWEDCRKYGFICAGGAKLYRNWMEKINEGDEIYAYVSGRGYVGFGEVIKGAKPFREARVNGQSLSEMDLVGKYDDGQDDDICDWIAFVEWKYDVAKDQAVQKPPIGRQTTCKVYEWRKDFVKEIKTELQER